MKKMLKIAGFFLLLFVGNVSMSTAQQSLIVAEGEDVTFNLRGVFTWGIDKGDKIGKVWVEDPLLGYRDLTGSAVYVLLNVQREQSGIYVFYAQWQKSGVIESYRAFLTVDSFNPFGYSASVAGNSSRSFTDMFLAVLPEERFLV